jgi:hypothetical protein
MDCGPYHVQVVVVALPDDYDLPEDAQMRKARLRFESMARYIGRYYDNVAVSRRQEFYDRKGAQKR